MKCYHSSGRPDLPRVDSGLLILPRDCHGRDWNRDTVISREIGA